MTRSGAATRDPATPLWWGTIGLRLITLLFAIGVLIVQYTSYQRAWLAIIVLAAMIVWTIVSGLLYARAALRWLRNVGFDAAVLFDVVVTCGLMLTSPLILSSPQYAASTPLITTVWAAVAPLAVGVRFGSVGGALSGLTVGVATALAYQRFDLSIARDGVLLVASGVLVGMAATTARRSAAALAEAMRTEAATAERERLARSIHDSVLQVLARVRRRGTELGGEAAELATLAGEQEIALRSLVSTQPSPHNAEGTTDLRAATQLLSASRVRMATPADPVPLAAHRASELLAVLREALSNVERHAGPSAMAWVLLEDLGDEVVLSVRDDGPGIPAGRLEHAQQQGHLGVAQSIKGRVAELGGTITLDTAPGAGTEWEIRVPRAEAGRDGRKEAAR